MFYSIANLAAQAATEMLPWECSLQRPAGLRTKEDYRAWCNSLDTNHAFFSAFSGRAPGIRVSTDNPPELMHGIVADYDDDALADPLAAVANRAGRCKPLYISQTFSGNVRAVWVFERPIPIFSPALLVPFLRGLHPATRHSHAFPGLDVGALHNVYQYYELGTHWRRVPQATPIPYYALLAILERVVEKHRWSSEGVTIPIEALRELGESRFPDRWPGGWERFAVGARGPRFWDPDSTNMSAAIVRETGMTYFSDGGGFRTWADIFGQDTVREWQDNRMGAAIADVFHLDGMYWSKNSAGFWAPDKGEDMRQHLIVSRGLSKEAPSEGETAEVDRALVFIRDNQRVEAAVPFLYRPDGLVVFNGRRYLNTSTLRPLPPAHELPPSEGMGFPWISQYLATAFDTEEDFWAFIGWLKHFYSGAVNQNLSRGLALFLAGPADAGKTRLNKAILAKLVGRSEDAHKFLQAKDPYNDRLFEAPLWTLDDAVPPGDNNARRIFGQFLKMVVANDNLTMRAMRRSGAEAPWTGRVVVTLNDDPESTQIIPDLEENTRDKIMLIKMKSPEFPAGMRRNPTDGEIMAELPYFARWLLDIELPDGVMAPGSRFGVRVYHNPDLEVVSERLSDTSSVEELLNVWRKAWFDAAPGVPHWEGNPTKLLADLFLLDEVGEVAKRQVRNPGALAKHLNKLVRHGCLWLVDTTEGTESRTYRILRP